MGLSRYFVTPAWRCLVCIAVLLAPGCAKTPDVEKITSLIDDMAAHAQAHKVSAFLAAVAEDFTGAPVASKHELQALLTFYFMRHKNINIVVTRKAVTVAGNAAEVEVQAFTTGSQQTLPERVQYFLIQGTLEKRAGEWWIVRASWQKLLGPDGAASAAD